MKVLAMGLVVIGLLLVYSQALGEEEKTLEEWGVPPISQWEFAWANYWDDDHDGYEETFCEHYLVSKVVIATFRRLDEIGWFRISVLDNKAGTIFIYEDLDHDGLWTRAEM